MVGHCIVFIGDGVAIVAGATDLSFNFELTQEKLQESKTVTRVNDRRCTHMFRVLFALVLFHVACRYIAYMYT